MSSRRPRWTEAPRRSWPARVDLFDTAGRRVLTMLHAPVEAGDWSTDADLSALAPGVYVVHASQRGRGITRRLVRLR
jgi:hypothetical protein